MKSITALLTFYIIFTTGFHFTKLAMLSKVKLLKYSMKYTDLGVELKRHTESISNVQFASNP